MSKRPCALVDLRWAAIPTTLQYPTTKAFGLTGYRARDGVDGIFSVYVKTLDGKVGVGERQRAKLFALVDAMNERLPVSGEKFVLTAGITVVAECETISLVEDTGDA